MKIKYFSCLFFLFLIFNSCLKFKFEDEKQVYPKIDFSKIKIIEVNNYKLENKSQITDSIKINSFSKFLRDSTNYFKSELIKVNGEKALFSIDFISKNDTLAIEIYPTEKKTKLELGFLDPKKLGDDKWKFRKYNRFYINSKLLDLITQEK